MKSYWLSSLSHTKSCGTCPGLEVRVGTLTAVSNMLGGYVPLPLPQIPW